MVSTLIAPGLPAPNFDGVPTPHEYREYLSLLLNTLFVARTDRVPLAEANGRILSQDISARMDVPSFDNSQMDGYALTAGAAERENRLFTVGREIPAGKPLLRSRASDDLAYPIMTGAPIPKGYDLVIPVEQSERIEYPDLPESYGRPSETIKLATGTVGQFVRRKGEDVQAGQLLARRGERITPALLGTLAAQGYSHVPVNVGPRVLVCTGGDEIRSELDNPQVREELEHGQIYDANGPMLAALLQEDGATVHRIAIGDNPDALVERLRRECVDFKPDIVLTSGGISHGKYEVMRLALTKSAPALGLPVITNWFGHVSQQPGGPQGVSVLDIDLHTTELRPLRATGTKGQLIPIISVPGNPVSTLISYVMLVRPVLRNELLHGVKTADQQARRAVLSLSHLPEIERVHGTPAAKTQFMRGTLKSVEIEPGVYRHEAHPDLHAGSHLLHRAAEADILIEMEPNTTYTGGEVVRYYPLRYPVA